MKKNIVDVSCVIKSFIFWFCFTDNDKVILLGSSKLETTSHNVLTENIPSVSLEMSSFPKPIFS